MSNRSSWRLRTAGAVLPLLASFLVSADPPAARAADAGTTCGDLRQAAPAELLPEQRLRVVALGGAQPQPLTAGASVLVPIVLRSGGAKGSFFSTELTFTNRGSNPASLELVYTAAFGGGDGTGSDTLAPGEQRIVPDAIAYLRSRGVPIPEGDGRGGTLLVRFSGLTSQADAAVTARTTTLVPEGRAGLAYAGITSGLTAPSLLAGLRQTAQDRSNLALLNAGTSGSVVLRVTVYSGAGEGAPKTLADVTLGPGGFQQFSGILNEAGFTNGYAKVERVGGTAPYYAYAVINDEANSDGSFVPPVLVGAYKSKTSLTLPVVVEAGAFTTEVVVTNTTTRQLSVGYTFVSDNVTTSNNTASQTNLPIAPGQQLIVPDFVQFMRDQKVPGIPDKGVTLAGPAVLTASDVDGVVLGARTSAPGGGGRYGLFYLATPNGGALSAASWVYGLQQDGENRSNLALVNTGASGNDTFKIEFFDGATGKPAGTLENQTVGPRRWMQINSVLPAGAPGVSNAYARITRTDGFSDYLAYAVVNDGAGPGLRSGDGAFVAADRDCSFDVKPYNYAFGGPFGWTGGNGRYFVSTSSGCAWTAVSTASWLRITDGASATTYDTVDFVVDRNDSAERRVARLVIAGEQVDIVQLGNTPGPYDGAWSGKTSQDLAISFSVEKSEVTTITLAFDVSMSACSTKGTLTLTPADSRPAIADGTLNGYFEDITIGNGRIDLRLRGTFTSPNAANGKFGIPSIVVGGSFCISSGDGAGATWTATRP